jgi:hypothetical protein
MRFIGVIAEEDGQPVRNQKEVGRPAARRITSPQVTSGEDASVSKEPKRFGIMRSWERCAWAKYGFESWSDDHHPRHVHAFIGSGEVKILLLAGGGVVAERPRGLTKSETRKAIAAAVTAFDELIALWDVTHGY